MIELYAQFLNSGGVLTVLGFSVLLFMVIFVLEGVPITVNKRMATLPNQTVSRKVRGQRILSFVCTLMLILMLCNLLLAAYLVALY